MSTCLFSSGGYKLTPHFFFPSQSSDSDSDSDSDGKEGNFSTLRELLIRPNAKPNGKDDAKGGKDAAGGKKKNKIDTVDEVISSVIDSGAGEASEGEAKPPVEQIVLKHFVRK